MNYIGQNVISGDLKQILPKEGNKGSIRQNTLRRSINCVGITLHGGEKVALTLRPAAADTGIVFRRIDIPGSKEIRASWDNVIDTRMCTTISNGDGVTVSTIEHLMSALAGCGIDNVYVEVPKVNLDAVIAQNDEVHCEINRYFNHQQSKFEEFNIFEEVDTEFIKFKRSAQKEVNYLVKEFECKKAADSYARATTARTGVLDTTKLHTYKYNEDLFKKVTTLADGKNHGLVFILDWSGSMSRVLLDTCKQLLILLKT